LPWPLFSEQKQEFNSEKYMFLTKIYLKYYALVWSLIIGAHFSVLHFFYELSVMLSIYDSLIFNILFAFLALSLWYLVRYSKSGGKLLSILSTHLLSALVVISFWLLMAFLPSQYLIDNANYKVFLEQSLAWRITSGVFYYALTILVYNLLLKYLELQEKIKQEAELKTLVKEVELSALKHQINPHFLFNSLNSVSSLTMSFPEKAQEMIIKLSDYLRYSLSQGEEHLTSLEKELSNIKLYLEIEKVRFGKRLEFSLNCNDEQLKAKMPIMLMQPLFENAIKHGVYESTETVHIRMDCQMELGYLNISIKNNFDKEAKPVKGAGVGLNNIQERLFLLYKQRDLLEVIKEEDCFIVNIKIPQND
jgi:sensor histidine kinase YesM